MALPPFRAGIAAGARAVMTAHLVVPPTTDVPAISRRILTGVLREQLGFTGVIVSDGLDMRAISTVGVSRGPCCRWPPGRTLSAWGPRSTRPDRARADQAIVGAVRDGRLPEARVHEAAARVRATALDLPAGSGAPDRALGRRAAAAALLVEGDAPALRAPVTVVDLRPAWNIAAGPSPFTLADALRPLLGEVRAIVLDSAGTGPDVPADGGSLVVVMRDAGRFEWQQACCAALVAARADAVVVETGLPGWRPAGSGTFVTTFGAGRASLEAAAAALVSTSVGAS